MGVEKITRRKPEAHEEPAAVESAHSLALKYRDEVFSGKTIEDAEAALAAAHPQFGDRSEEVLIGFATADGRFLSRKEAFDQLMREGDLKNATHTELL